ncbi:MAG: glycosyl transferase, partial [Bacteroidota bacterium]
MKILIIRFSSIGDIVLTTPVVRNLKIQRDATVHYVTKQAYRSILSSNPYIDKIHVLNGSLGSLITELRKENF